MIKAIKEYIGKVAKGNIKVIGVSLMAIGAVLWGIEEVKE